MAVRRRAVTVAVAVAVACLSPLLWPAGRDDFPLTPYPMFAVPRSDADVVVVVAMGVTPDGEHELPTEATGHAQLTQAVAALADAVREGGDRPQQLCDEVAVWAAESDLDDVFAVRLVTAAYDGLAYLLDGGTEPTVVAQHAWCGVRR
jgi:hypothetical protein